MSEAEHSPVERQAIGACRRTTLVGGLRHWFSTAARPSNFRVTFEAGASLDDAAAAIEALRDGQIGLLSPDVDSAAAGGLKFSECVPLEMVLAGLQGRLRARETAGTTLSRSLRVGSAS